MANRITGVGIETISQNPKVRSTEVGIEIISKAGRVRVTQIGIEYCVLCQPISTLTWARLSTTTGMIFIPDTAIEINLYRSLDNGVSYQELALDVTGHSRYSDTTLTAADNPIYQVNRICNVGTHTVVSITAIITFFTPPTGATFRLRHGRRR